MCILYLWTQYKYNRKEDNLGIYRKWLSTYQFNQPNKFNEEIIYDLREKDYMVDYLEDVCKALEAIPYIKYDGYEIITDENEFKEQETINISETRLDLIIFKFTITFKEQVSKISMPLFIPKWINKYYFILNGNKYYPIYQNVESSTYNSQNSVTLKSLLMAIILNIKPFKIEDVDGNEYHDQIFMLNLFKHKSNFLYYFFATMGVEETIKFFGYENDIELGLESKKKGRLIFNINKSYSVIVSKKKFKNDITYRRFIFNLIEISNKKTNIDKFYDQDYWMIKLGSIFTKNTNNQYAKAENIILSFKRILDERTKKNLLIDPEDKEDIFCAIRWMIQKFEILMKKDNLSLLNKRLRISEYVITPFVRKMSENTYRILNSKTITMNKLQTIVRPNSNIIITMLQKSKLLRYNNSTNDMDLFNCALKFSNRGPSSIGEGSNKKISVMYRGIYPSHLGRLSLNSCSASDPGMSGVISPFIKTNKFYYNTTSEIVQVDPEEELVET